MAEEQETSDDILNKLTPEERLELEQYVTGSSPMPEEKHNVHKFLHEVAESDDTTKTGYLSEEEIGLPKLPIRTLKSLALYCDNISNMPYFSDYFLKESEIISSTSLSKDAKLLSLAVTSVRQLADVTPKVRKKSKGWFKKKKGGEE